MRSHRPTPKPAQRTVVIATMAIAENQDAGPPVPQPATMDTKNQKPKRARRTADEDIMEGLNMGDLIELCDGQRPRRTRAMVSRTEKKEEYDTIKIDNNVGAGGRDSETGGKDKDDAGDEEAQVEESENIQEPPQKKRRIVLNRTASADYPTPESRPDESVPPLTMEALRELEEEVLDKGHSGLLSPPKTLQKFLEETCDDTSSSGLSSPPESLVDPRDDIFSENIDHSSESECNRAVEVVDKDPLSVAVEECVLGIVDHVSVRDLRPLPGGEPPLSSPPESHADPRDDIFSDNIDHSSESECNRAVEIVDKDPLSTAVEECVSGIVDHVSGLDLRPLPQGEPPVWSDKRQALCDSLPWYKAHQGSIYTSGLMAHGLLLDGEYEFSDIVEGQVIITSV